jgi:hypothetical protein
VNYKLLILCILFQGAHYVTACQKANIHGHQPLSCSEGEMFSLTYTPNTAIELGTYIVSTIAQERDADDGDYTAIYLGNIDKKKNDLVIRQTEKTVLRLIAYQENVALRNSHETLYKARLKQINERAKSQGKEFNMFNAKYKLISITWNNIENVSATYEKNNLFDTDLATFSATRDKEIAQVFENRSKRNRWDRIAIGGGIAVAAILGITYGAYKKFIKS